MTPLDLAVRNATYRRFAARGRAPTAREVATAAGIQPHEVIEAWRRLHDAHALVLIDRDAEPPAIRMLNPFSAVETVHRVEAQGRTWFANCAWDAFGIGAALQTDSVIHTSCPDCHEPIDIEVRAYRPADPDPTDEGPVFHVLVPAREWWTDIGFT